ncbi:MAG: hypothetical protein JNK87_20170 [Bryobacterales bacterium]|nr:hypothetical protein [Bryobacterales bacterium]
MAEHLYKLSPDRDLQCYFERPSASAALSGASGSGFTVSGTWRQQFDWAVLEWNRDNVFEHPAFRNLPDGDLSGLTLTYDEERTNCIPLDSTLFPTVDWPYLRIWTNDGSGDAFYKVSLKGRAVAVAGSYIPATADFELGGTLTVGDYVGLAWEGEQYNHLVTAGDSLETVLDDLVGSVNSLSPTVEAARITGGLRLTYVGTGQTAATSTLGHNGNRIGVYGYVSGARSEVWTPQSQTFSGGQSPSKWRVTIDFGNLTDITGATVPTNAVRKMRWTYSAAMQSGAYQRSEFAVTVTNWTVSGSNRQLSIAGKGSVRKEDADPSVVYGGTWQTGLGNFSGGSIRYSSTPASAVTVSYHCGQSHTLYLGTRYAAVGSTVSVQIDGGPATQYQLQIPGEDVLARVKLGAVNAGTHAVVLTHTGDSGEYFYFDFLEAAVLSTDLPEVAERTRTTLATDWDTDHSLAIAAERTAWMMKSMGFMGRANHYVGALWFYELALEGHSYASATVTFTGTPVFSEITTVTIGRVGQSVQTELAHLNLMGETAADIAKAFELVVNSGYTAVRATSSGNVLTIYSRSLGADGNEITLSATPGSGAFTAVASGTQLSGGVNGTWYTDLNATPRVNRACRDWSRGYYAALHSYGIDVAGAFSMELQHGNPSPTAGIAQRYPSGQAVVLNTPAIQTNFSPVSLNYWRQVYLEMATEMAAAGVTPYLQFGEVQWWYFPYDGSGLPFHDDYTKAQFQSTFGFPLRAVPDGSVDPALYPEEAGFLPELIGAFTNGVISFVKATFPNARFEVLYPTDVNEGAFNRVVNYPSAWNPTTLTCLKSESFLYTYARNLNQCIFSMRFAESKGFGRDKRSHLVGISDALSPWRKEVMLAEAEHLESVVLFALDQYCLIGHPLPMGNLSRRSARMATPG